MIKRLTFYILGSTLFFIAVCSYQAITKYRKLKPDSNPSENNEVVDNVNSEVIKWKRQYDSRIVSHCAPVDTAKLNSAYRALTVNPGSLERQKDFFYAFPSTWMEYFMTYHNPCNNENYKKNMYQHKPSHLDAFQKMLPSIPDTIYYDKLINLCIGGKMEPTHFGLRDILYEVLSEKPHEMFDRLSKHTRGFQLRFWQFYWSSLHKLDSNVAEFRWLKGLLGHTMPDAVKIMEMGFEFATEEFEMHHPYEDFPHRAFRNTTHGDHPIYYFYLL